MIHNVNHAEPGDYELEWYEELDCPECGGIASFCGLGAHVDERVELLHAEVDADEHVDGCDCVTCYIAREGYTAQLLREHNRFCHDIVVEGCPACESYGDEETRMPNWEYVDTDAPF